MSDGVIIRPMTEQDLAQVMPIENESFSTPWSEKSYRDTLQLPYAVLLVAVSVDTSYTSHTANMVLGYCGAILAVDEGDILNVAVRADCRGRGIGKRLVAELVRQTVERGCRKLFLEVRESNEPAIAVYKGAGFTEIGKRKNYYHRPTEDALLMMRTEEETNVIQSTI